MTGREKFLRTDSLEGQINKMSFKVIARKPIQVVNTLQTEDLEIEKKRLTGVEQLVLDEALPRSK